MDLWSCCAAYLSAIVERVRVYLLLGDKVAFVPKNTTPLCLLLLS